LRVLDGEAGTLNAVDVIHLGAAEQRGALRVHDHFHPALLDDGVVLADLRLEGHAVLIAMAAAALHEDAETFGLRFLDHELAYLLLRMCRQRDHDSFPPLEARWAPGTRPHAITSNSD